MSTNSIPYQVLLGSHFRDAQRRYAGDRALMKNVHEALLELAEGRVTPGRDRMRVGNEPRRPLYKIRLNEADRLLFEGPFHFSEPVIAAGSEPDSSPVLVVHDFGRHDDIQAMLERALGRPPQSGDLSLVSAPRLGEPVDAPDLERHRTWVVTLPALLDFDAFDILMQNLAAGLRLSPNQHAALRAELPILLQGQAGSGKSIVLCHHFAGLCHTSSDPAASDRPVEGAMVTPNVRPELLYISQNPRLVERAQSDVRAILKAVYDVGYPPPQSHFASYRDLLRQFVPDASRFDELHRVGWARFRDDFYRNRHGVSAEVAWHAIRSFFKGACLPPDRPPLASDLYASLPRRRQELDVQVIRALYPQVVAYQNWLAADEKRWDDLDLAWTSLEYLRSPGVSTHQYQVLYCDEAQDLTELDYEILVRLCKVHRKGDRHFPGLVAAGDPLQTINPSGFRWSVVKERVFRAVQRTTDTELAVQTVALPDNFRSDEWIVKLANAILAVREQYGDERITAQTPRSQKLVMPSTFDIRGNTTTLFVRLGQLPPSSGILVNEEEDKDPLIAEGISKERLYTVMEAKGLEFDVVVLWRLGDGNTELWSRLATAGPISELQRIPLLYLLNRLYVAVTRGMQFVLICDSTEVIKERWRRHFGDHLGHTPEHGLVAHPWLQQVATNGDWMKWADELEAQEEFERAAHAYKKASNDMAAARCLAFAARDRGQYAAAAGHFVEAQMYYEAAEMFFGAKMWHPARTFAEKSGRGRPAERLAARAAFEEHFFGGDFERAIAGLQKSIEHDTERDAAWIGRAADVLVELKRFETAAKYYLRVNAFERAADSLLEVGRWEEALSAYLRAGSDKARRHRAEGEVHALRGDWATALPCFRRAKDWTRVLSVAETLDDPIVQSEALIELAAHARAVPILERALAGVKDLEIALRLRRWLLDCRMSLKQYAAARPLAEELENWTIATVCAEQMGAPAREVRRLRVEALAQRGDYEGAANLLEEAGDIRRAKELRAKGFLQRGKFDDAMRLYEQMLFFRTIVTSHAKRRGGEELGVRRVLDMFGKLSMEDRAKLQAHECREDRRAIAEIRTKFRTLFLTHWDTWSGELQRWCLIWVPAETDADFEHTPAEVIAPALLARRRETLTGLEKKHLAEAVTTLIDLDLWGKWLALQDVGRAYEWAERPSDAIRCYDAVMKMPDRQTWMIEGAIRAREMLLEVWKRSNAPAEKTIVIAQQINDLRAQLEHNPPNAGDSGRRS
jgi:tetratricopeptide (TPR) repeat protein